MVTDGIPNIDDPRTIREASFSTSFRGFDQLEVKAFLQTLARQLSGIDEMRADAQAKVEAAERELEAAKEIDESILMARLGEDATAILQTARDQAAERVAQAEQDVADLRARVDADVAEIRAAAERQAAEVRAELEAKQAALDESVSQEAAVREQQRAEVVAAAESDAEALRAQARSEGDQTLADAREEGRAMVAEARIVRERILADLSRRRTNAKVQLEQLRAGRQRLLDAIEVASEAVADVNRELENSLPEARQAAETAGLTVPAPASTAEIESEIVSARLVGNPFVTNDEVARSLESPMSEDQDDSRIVEDVAADEPDTAEEVEADPQFDDAAFDSPGLVLAELGDDQSSGFRRKKNLPPVADELPREEVPTIELEADFEQVRALDPTMELHPVQADDHVDAAAISEPPNDVPELSLVESPPEEALQDEPAEDELVSEELVEEEPVEEELVSEELAEEELVEEELVEEAANEVPVDDEVEKPEAEPEQTADVEATEEAPAQDDVDALFNRLRADREERVAHATEVLAAVPALDEPDSAANSAAEDTEVPASERFQKLEDALAERRASVADLEKSVGRKLKRHLAEEQNEVLDLIRRGEVHSDDPIDELLGSIDTHCLRYVEAVATQLQTAAAAGAASVGGQAPPIDTGAVQTLIADEWLSSTRLLIQRVIADGDDVDDIIDHLRSLYREVKGQRLGGVASSMVVSAYNLGVHAGLAAEHPVRWELAPDSDCGQECTSNVVAGLVTAGTAFPSGHLHPPATVGCRCLLVAEEDLQSQKIS